MNKHKIVTGGVISGLGKRNTAAQAQLPKKPEIKDDHRRLTFLSLRSVTGAKVSNAPRPGANRKKGAP